MSESRRLPVPEGLVGERIDVALSRMLGLSRSAVAELCAQGAVHVDGHVAAKSDRLLADHWIDVAIPTPVVPGDPEPVEGVLIRHDDDDLVVIDKPVGVAAHPSPGWTGPRVIGGLAAAGYRISTSSARKAAITASRLPAANRSTCSTPRTSAAKAMPGIWA